MILETWKDVDWELGLYYGPVPYRAGEKNGIGMSRPERTSLSTVLESQEVFFGFLWRKEDFLPLEDAKPGAAAQLGSTSCSLEYAISLPCPSF